MDLAQSVVENKGWKNHESSHEEAIRREMLCAIKELDLIKQDMQELSKSYYDLLSKNKALVEENQKIKRLYYNEKHKRLLPNSPNNFKRSR